MTKTQPAELKKNPRKNLKNKNEFLLSESELRQLASDILKKAQKLGASSAEIGATVGYGYNVSVRMGKVESIENNRGKELSITVYFGKRTGSASTSDFKQESINLAIEKACHIARYTSDDPYAGLAEAALMAYDYPDLELYHPWQISIAKAIDLAKECEASGLNYDKKIINSDGVTVNNAQSLGIYANTHGFVGAYPSTLHSMSCALIAKEKLQMQRDSDYTIARFHQALAKPKILGESAAKLTLRRLGARRIKSCVCPVIFEANIAKTLISHLLSAASGGNLYNKTSFLCDHLDKQVLAKHVSVDEKPLIPKALGSAAFDREGVRTKEQMIVEDGMLKRYILGSYSARKLNLKTTGNAGGCYNIFVTAKQKEMDFKALLKEMNKGLIVIELLGHGVNLVTGDYSRGAFGLWVENGEIQHPVEGITVAGNLKDMLLNIVAVGNDIDKRDSVFTGSILFPKMMVGGLV